MMKRLATLTLIIVFGSVSSLAKAYELHLLQSGQRVMQYNANYIPSPKKEAPWYGRSGFIHPVYTPSGRIVSDGFPQDHLHQHGLMFAWTSARVDGRPVDFWNSKALQGHVEHVETVHADADSIVAKLHHIDDEAATPTVVVEETWEMNRIPHKSMNVFDLLSTQICVTDKPLVIAEYDYGAMCIRGPSHWLQKVTMITSEGHNKVSGNHTEANWVVMHGKVDGKDCGIAAFGHPDNFRAPQPVRLHPTKPYFCFAPMVAGEFALEPGKPYVSQFRFAAFDGKPDLALFDEVWKELSRR